jgi:anti-sigma B factor antagonist
MEITRIARDGLTELAVEGRIDSYWADHLDAALAEVVRAGEHRVRVELSRASFLSSAGVGVLVKYYKQLTRLDGALLVAKPSDPVRLVLEMTRVAPMLVEVEAPPEAPTPGMAMMSPSRTSGREWSTAKRSGPSLMCPATV